MRPEVIAFLRRWAEPLAGGALALLGLWWATGSVSVIGWLGWPVAMAGAALVWSGIQRGRFRPGSGGPGVVQVDERRLAYFGPLTGGIVDLDDLAALDWDASGRPGHWVLTAGTGEEVAIPANAEGAEALFDAFAALPGLGAERLIAVQRRTEPARHPVWRRSGTRLRLGAD